MCGRFSFANSKERINKHFGINLSTDLQPSYNIAPTHQAYVITNTEPTTVKRLTWGLVPHWAKSSRVGSNLINARAESIATKPSFRMPIRNKRCLVLADGFYEWRKYGKAKRPYRITKAESNQLMVFAGIWDTWLTPENIAFSTFSIITTPANEQMKIVHDRMPFILNTIEEQQQWLQDVPLKSVLNMIKILPEGELKIFPVSSKVNKPTYNEPDLYTPIDEMPTLFDFT